MSRYVDGFVLPLKEDQAEAYLKIAEAAGKIWMDHGALAYVECLGDDLHVEEMTPFPVMAGAVPGKPWSSHGLCTHQKNTGIRSTKQ
jgi:uncharacterized protein YbaA (DUF1428 family)